MKTNKDPSIMIPGNAEIIECPFCGAKKELMSLMSEDTHGARIWSDGKRIAPMMPEVSTVQKCPQCGKYYYEPIQSYALGDHCSFELGELSYQEWKEAYYQFANDKDGYLLFVGIGLIRAYNDHFRSGSMPTLPQEEDDFIAGIIKECIDSDVWRNNSKPLLTAEYYREANEMKKCAEVLSEIDQASLTDFETKFFAAIKERMENGDRRVFELTLN